MTQQPSETIASSSGPVSITFDDLALCPEVRQAIAQMGFEQPTAIQAEAIPVALAGSDIVAMAQTGTGKTAAFAIPIVQRLDLARTGIQALVLVPTRELALQVSREVGAIGSVRGVRTVAVYGGASFTTQVSEVSSGAQVVVGTPGRVLDHLRRGTIKFDNVRNLVLDEADEMLSMGFEKEISEIIEGLPTKRQTLLFSATIPGDIQRLAQRYMGEPTVISLSGDDVAAKEIEHYVYLVSGQGRAKDLVRVLGVERPENAIVFCNTREETQTVARALQAAGYDADWINSDLSQSERERVMSATRAGKLKFLVATDVAARGIDISILGHVINFTFPDSLEVYIHRTGRTGRMGRRGAAISLIAPQDIGNLYYLRLTYKIRTIEKQLPDVRQEQLALELTQFGGLRRAFGGSSHEFTQLARRVSQSIYGEGILAGLLAEHFTGVGQATPEPVTAHWVDEVVPPAMTAPRGPRPPRGENLPIQEPDDEPGDRSSKRKRGPRNSSDDILTSVQRPQAAAMPETEPTPPPPAEPEETDFAEVEDEGVAESTEPEKEIYIDAGRKDGVRISQLMKDLVDRTGLPRTAVGKVRMMARATFLKVPTSHFDAVLVALSRMEIDGRKLKAEPARE